MSSSPSTTEIKELSEPDIEEIKEINGDKDKVINEEEPEPVDEDIKSSESEDDRPIWDQGKPKRHKRPKYEVEVPIFRELPKRVANKINYAEINSDEDEDCISVQKPKKQRKHDSSDEDESWSEDEDSDSSIRKTTKRQEDDDADEEEEEEKNEKPLSEYEKLLEKNRAEKMAFLQSLKMNEAKEDLHEVIASMKRKKPVKKTERVEKSPPVMRKSSRLDNKTFDYSEDALFHKVYQDAQANEHKVPPVMSVKELLESEEMYEGFLKDIVIQESKVDSKPLYYSKSVLKKLKLGESTYTRFRKDVNIKISALAWYPSSESLILAGGCAYGNLSLQNVGTESSQYLFKVHSKKIANVKFNPFNPVHLVSCSEDGTLRSGDMEKQIFSEVYNVSGKTFLNDFDFLTESAYVTAHNNGDIAMIDIRTSGKRYQKQCTCHESTVYNVQVHPVNKDIFLTTDKCIRIWDIRKLAKKPLVDVQIADKGRQKAVFSPVTGNYILSTSCESIRIYDSSNLTTSIKLKKHKRIAMKGKGISYRACWLPNSEEEFFIGSKTQPWGIQVCDTYMNVINFITHEHLSSFSTVNVFHPYTPALAVGKHTHRGIFIFT